MPPPCFQRPWRSISWVGAPFWAMRRAMPTRPLWPLKNSQSERPADLAITFTRRAICESDSPNTFTAPPTRRRPDGFQRFHDGGSDGHHGALGFGVGLGADYGDAAAAVVPALDVAQVSDAASERLRPASDSTATRARSNLPSSSACSAVSKPRPRLRGSTAVSRMTASTSAGEGAGLALRLGQPSSPSF